MPECEETLIHYSREPLTTVQSIPLTDQVDHFKPKGLWVSVAGDDDWRSWCLAEGFWLENLKFPHRIVLSESANILRLTTASGIDDFTRQFSLLERRRRTSSHDIDWRRVAKGWDGIIIAPYVWERRLNGGANWYYSWDCASGCIWIADAIEQIVPMAQEEIVLEGKAI